MCIILIVMCNCHYFVSNCKCIWFLIHTVMYKCSCVMSNSKYVKHIFILLSVNVIVLPQTVSLLGTFFTSLCSNVSRCKMGIPGHFCGPKKYLCHVIKNLCHVIRIFLRNLLIKKSFSLKKKKKNFYKSSQHARGRQVQDQAG